MNPSATPPGGKKSPEINQATFDLIVKTQHQSTINEAENLKLRHKEADNQARYAENLLKHQAEHIKSIPTENRKTITRIAVIIGVLLCIGLGFITLWIYLGQADFAKEFMAKASYVILSAISFWAGRKSVSSKKEENTNEPEEAKVVS